MALTFEFSPSVGDLILNAYSRIGVRRPSLTAEHMVDARLECNLLQAEWSNQQVNLWTVDRQDNPLVQGQATYVLPTETIALLDCYISIENGNSPSTDRVIMPVSRTEYSSYPDKTIQGTPNVFWFDRLNSPTITLWPVPDGAGPYTLRYYRCRQIADAAMANGAFPDVPYRWLDAWVAALAMRLARIHAPERLQDSQAEAARAWGIAATQDVENVPLRITPGMAGYYRQ